MLCGDPSDTPAGIVQSHKLGRVASLIGVEGGHSIGTSLGVLRMFYRLGVRYLTITHTCNTLWADCCLVDEPGRVPHIGGLSHFGTVWPYSTLFITSPTPYPTCRPTSLLSISLVLYIDIGTGPSHPPSTHTDNSL